MTGPAPTFFIDTPRAAAAQENARTTADVHVLLAHGAGAPMDSPFMTSFAEALAARGVTVARFEFAYMAARRHGGPKRPPPRADHLMDEYRAILAAYRARLTPGTRLFIGGKSMGGRIASLIGDDAYADAHARGVVCLGYPFHPQGKPEQLRTEHLAALDCPTLIVQGDRDPFGNRDEVTGYTLSAQITLHWISDGDHDFGPRGRSGVTRSGNITAAADAVAKFVAG